MSNVYVILVLWWIKTLEHHGTPEVGHRADGQMSNLSSAQHPTMSKINPKSSLTQ